MKQIVINIEDKKYKFFMELIKNLDFVTVVEKNTIKKRVMKKIAAGIKASILAGNGKIETQSAKSFLGEL